MRKRFLLHKFFVLAIVVTSSISLAGCGLSGCGKKKDKADTMVGVTVSGSGLELDISGGNEELVVSDSSLGTQGNNATSTPKPTNGKTDSDNGNKGNTTGTPTSSSTATPTATQTPGVGNSGAAATTAPTEKPTATQKPTATPKPTATAKPVVTTAPTAKPSATVTPTAQPTAKPSATPKPAATTKPSATATPKPTQTPGIAAHTCVWNTGSITKAATCMEEGVKSYTCTICNTIKTESIAKTDHKYSTINLSASCTEPGTVIVSCDICGYVNSSASSGSALGHDYVKQWTWGVGPTCAAGASYYEKCSRCGAVGDEGFEEHLPHTMEGTITFDGDCSDPTIVEYRCAVCGAPGGYDYYYTDEHDWVEGLTAPYWSEEAQDFVQDTVTYCSRCNASP